MVRAVNAVIVRVHQQLQNALNWIRTNARVVQRAIEPVSFCLDDVYIIMNSGLPCTLTIFVASSDDKTEARVMNGAIT